MDERTLSALRASISKWKMIAEGQYASVADRNCPLCRIFRCQKTLHMTGCPIDIYTKNLGCYGTPWDDFVEAVISESPAGSYNKKYFTGGLRLVVWGPLSRAAAWAEYEFLKSLLPEGA